MAWNPVGNILGPQGPQGTAGTTNWSGITDKPTTFSPSAHIHALGDITGLSAQLASKVVQTGDGSKVYGTDGGGAQQAINYNLDPYEYTIAMRRANGRMSVSDPELSTDAATKAYADTKLGSSNGTILDVVKLTQAQYNALGSGRPATTFYVIVG